MIFKNHVNHDNPKNHGSDSCLVNCFLYYCTLNFKVMRKRLILVFVSISCSLCAVRFSFGQGTWIQRTNFPGSARTAPFSFSIGNKGYVGAGYDSTGGVKDFWEYDPSLNNWTQKADYAGGPTYAAIGFSILNKGYAGLGINNLFYEYDPTTNVWTPKTSYPTSSVYYPAGFTIGNFGYVCTGGSPGSKELWQYNPILNAWTQKSNLPGVGRQEAIGFSIGAKGYVGSGTTNGTICCLNDFWEYDTLTNLWTQKANVPLPKRADAAGFSICNKGYVAGGDTFGLLNDLWEYDPNTNQWTQKANMLGPGRDEAAYFAIGNKEYLGLGDDIIPNNDFYEYAPDSTVLCSQCVPIAIFNTSDTSFCNEPAKCISFTDLSSCNPTSWQWLFPGATPNFSNQQNPTNICYSTPGTYPVTLTVTNAAGSDTLTVSPMITVGSAPLPPIITVVGGDTLYSSHAAHYQWYRNGTLIPNATDSFYIASQGGIYSVQITDGNGCYSLSSGIAVGVDELGIGSLEFSVYPIPAGEWFRVSGLEFGVKAEISLYNVLGEKVYDEQLQTSTTKPETINCKPFPAGVYILKISSEAGILNKKVIIER